MDPEQRIVCSRCGTSWRGSHICDNPFPSKKSGVGYVRIFLLLLAVILLIKYLTPGQ
jgi:hypothetical protein